jgi:hypothetical protein
VTSPHTFVNSILERGYIKSAYRPTTRNDPADVRHHQAFADLLEPVARLMPDLAAATSQDKTAVRTPSSLPGHMRKLFSFAEEVLMLSVPRAPETGYTGDTTPGAELFDAATGDLPLLWLALAKGSSRYPSDELTLFFAPAGIRGTVQPAGFRAVTLQSRGRSEGFRSTGIVRDTDDYLRYSMGDNTLFDLFDLEEGSTDQMLGFPNAEDWLADHVSVLPQYLKTVTHQRQLTNRC